MSKLSERLREVDPFEQPGVAEELAYEAADALDAMEAALRGLIANACAAAEVLPGGVHRIDCTVSEWAAHVQATAQAKAALAKLEGK